MVLLMYIFLHIKYDTDSFTESYNEPHQQMTYEHPVHPPLMPAAN